MVAITVILAAVIGTFVLGLGDQVQTTAPQASFEFEFFNDGGSTPKVTMTHTGGDTIPSSDTLTTTVSSNSWADSTPTWTPAVGAGDSITKELDASSWSGETVRIVWKGSNGDTSAVLGKNTAPNN
jgi:FlaG/FlaF family flagellin (archaellin)